MKDDIFLWLAKGGDASRFIKDDSIVILFTHGN
jgi:hypothetical protein